MNSLIIRRLLLIILYLLNHHVTFATSNGLTLKLFIQDFDPQSSNSSSNVLHLRQQSKVMRQILYRQDEYRFIAKLGIGTSKIRTPLRVYYLNLDTGMGSTPSFRCGLDQSDLFYGMVSMNKIAGVLGLGRGPLSFLSQIDSISINGKFSYCFPHFDEMRGALGDIRITHLRFGADAMSPRKIKMMRTKLHFIMWKWMGSASIING